MPTERGVLSMERDGVWRRVAYWIAWRTIWRRHRPATRWRDL
jgi:hypothetical protein